MCNITFIDKIDSNVLPYFKSLVIDSATYNDDGFGLFSDKIMYKSHNSLDKDTFKKVKKVISNDIHDFIILHSRKATTGDVLKENSHPFTTHNLTYVHNGMISNHKKINSELKVDSEVIGYLVEKFLAKKLPIEKAIIESMKLISGSCSTFIYEHRTKRLFYIRHNATFEFYRINYGNKDYLLGNTDYSGIYELFNHKTDGKIYFDSVIKYRYNIDDDILYEITFTDGISELVKLNKVKFKVDEVKFSTTRYCDVNELNNYDGSMDLPTLIKSNEKLLNRIFGRKTTITEIGNDKFIVDSKDVANELKPMGFNNYLTEHDLGILNEILINDLDEDRYSDRYIDDIKSSRKCGFNY